MHKHATTFRYLATFPAGTYPIIARQLKKFGVGELGIASHDDSSVTFTSNLRHERLIELRFFTNVFLIFEGKLGKYKKAIKGNAYRLGALTEGMPSEIPAERRRSIQTVIQKEFSLHPQSHGATNDFFLLSRGGQEMLSLRLSRAKHKRQELPKGALRPEVAHILLLAAGIRAKDTLLDPFAGSGSIATEAQRGFGVRTVLAFDAEPQQPFIKAGDATNLDAVNTGTVDRIVTDPPWGQYQGYGSLANVYAQFLAEAKRVLKPRGIMVILVGDIPEKGVFLQADGFELLKQHSVLISGKKAAVIKLQKQN